MPPPGVYAGTVVGSNKPQDRVQKKLMWKDNNNKLYVLILGNALHYHPSPVIFISITKLGSDHNDTTLSIQTFYSHSSLTWDIRKNSMAFKNGTSNLPELDMFSSFDHLSCLTIHLEDSSMCISKNDHLRLFGYVS